MIFLLILSVISSIFIIQSYMESIFKRAEHQFKTLDEQIGWLSSFKAKPGNAYERDAVKVAEDLQKGVEIMEEAKVETSLPKLKSLFKEANKLKFNQDKPLKIVEKRIKDIETEIEEREKKEAETREKERISREAEEVERIERTLIEEASTMAFNDGKISKIVKTEEERRDLSLREKQILGRYMTQLR